MSTGTQAVSKVCRWNPWASPSESHDRHRRWWLRACSNPSVRSHDIAIQGVMADSRSSTDHSWNAPVSQTSLSKPSASRSTRTSAATTPKKSPAPRLHAHNGWTWVRWRWPIWLARTSWSSTRWTIPAPHLNMPFASWRRMSRLRKRAWVGRVKRLLSLYLFCTWVLGFPFDFDGLILTVLQNKDKAKKGKLPEEMITAGRYHAAVTTSDVWICYPWEAKYVPFRQYTSRPHC